MSRPADIQAQPRRIEHDFGQRGRILQAEIETLPGDRMDAMGGVAREREARLTICARQMETQRIGPARSATVRRAQMRPEAPCDFLVEASSDSASIAGAMSSRSVHTSDERLPVIGRIANGPDGRKCS